MRKYLALSALLISLITSYKFVESLPTIPNIKTAVATLAYDTKNECCPEVPQSRSDRNF